MQILKLEARNDISDTNDRVVKSTSYEYDDDAADKSPEGDDEFVKSLLEKRGLILSEVDDDDDDTQLLLA